MSPEVGTLGPTVGTLASGVGTGALSVSVLLVDTVDTGVGTVSAGVGIFGSEVGKLVSEFGTAVSVSVTRYVGSCLLVDAGLSAGSRTFIVNSSPLVPLVNVTTFFRLGSWGGHV